MQGAESCLPSAVFPMRHPDMLIGRPEPSEYPEVSDWSEYACDTQTWD